MVYIVPITILQVPRARLYSTAVKFIHTGTSTNKITLNDPIISLLKIYH